MFYPSNDPRDLALTDDDWFALGGGDDDDFFQTRCYLPQTALCLKVPGLSGDELVVHRENGEDYVFLFEALDDAYDYANEAKEALLFAPRVGRVTLRELNFANARYKPALSEQVDLVLRPV